ncbi:hypothetical protein ONZ43_g7243 [Nemania bipapillata]|uniref:Uncharacterized protein n=1 Tax=Nemania bipapillata TaxID=110536 RepID=A0ACC2HT63_9PEZI|nr:hypothetical protein ONZ43_g7243 [Nemania bipapillata]
MVVTSSLLQLLVLGVASSGSSGPKPRRPVGALGCSYAPAAERGFLSEWKRSDIQPRTPPGLGCGVPNDDWWEAPANGM